MAVVVELLGCEREGEGSGGACANQLYRSLIYFFCLSRGSTQNVKPYLSSARTLLGALRGKVLYTHSIRTRA